MIELAFGSNDEVCILKWGQESSSSLPSSIPDFDWKHAFHASYILSSVVIAAASVIFLILMETTVFLMGVRFFTVVVSIRIETMAVSLEKITF